MKIQLATVRCRRCGHAWVPRRAEVRRCAKCKSEYFATPRRSRQGMRPKRKAS